MIYVKRYVGLGIISLELTIFASLYIFGPQGLLHMKKIYNQTSEIYRCELTLQKEIDVLDSEIQKWQSDTFHKEKFAREQLQMARAGEKIYFY